MTKKLYYEDVYLREFDATVTSIEERDGKFYVTLDQTAFYPEGGGQPSDVGTLGGVEVEHVFEEGGAILHVLTGRPEGTLVHGEMDWGLRLNMMQQHLGEHILSGVLLRNLDARAVSVHFGESASTVDIDRHLDQSQLDEAEDAANEVVYGNMAVEILYPDTSEIERLSRRKIPNTSERIRIVKVGDVDYVPCCGTHPMTTGEVGPIKIFGGESHKGGMRITFACGRTAMRKYRSVWRNAVTMQGLLSTDEADLPERVAKLMSDLRDFKRERQALLGRIAAADALRLLDEAEKVGEYRVVCRVFDSAGPEELRCLFSRLTEDESVVALLAAPAPGGASLVFGCNKSEKAVDIRTAFSPAIGIIGGKGGGNRIQAQGSGPAADRLAEAMESAKSAIVKAIEGLR